MSNEFQHKSVGSQMTQTEYEHTDGTGHIFDSQAAGDILFASSSTVLSKLAIGTAGKVLAVNSGASAPEYVAALTGVTSVLNAALVVGRDADNDIDFATDNNIIFRAGAQDQIKLIDGALSPVTDSDVDLGTSSLYYKDAYIDSITTTGNITLGGNLASSGDFTIDSGADIVLDADGADVLFKDAGTTYGSATNNSGNLIIKSGTTTALTFSGADVAVAGDLTITGDDLFMGTNTAGMLLIADGTNFNPTAVTSLSAITSIDNADTFLAIDNDDGALKKVARSVVVSGLATSGAISNVADDSDPHLGGNLDVQTNSIITDTGNRNIKLKPNGTGKVEIQGNTDSSGTNPGTIILNCEQNTHGQTIKAQAHSASVTNTLTLPAGGDGELVSTVATQTLTNKTLTSPKINEDVAVTATATELNILDGVTATASELNIMDGNTSVGTTAVADGDGIVTNDGGTMKQTSVETFATYFGSEITSMSNLTSVGTLTTLTVDNVITNGTTIGHTDDTDLMTLADGVLTVAGNLDVSGSVETATIDFTDGDNALTIADGGGVTFPQAATFTGGFTANDDINLAKQKVIKIGGTQEAHDFGDDHSGHGITVTMEAGENLTLGAAVYVDSNGKAQHPDVDASSVTGKPAIGIAMSSASSGASVNILVLGLFHDDSYNFTPGSPIIMTGTDGALTTTASDTAADGDIVQRIGIAITADTAFIMPSIDEIEHA